MAAVQSRLPAPPSHKIIEKNATKQTVTTKLRKPTTISTLLTAPSSKQANIPAQEQKKKKLPSTAPATITAPSSKQANIPAQEQRKKKLPSTAPATITTPKKKSPKITVPTKKPDFAHVKPRIGSLDNATHKPKGGDKKIYSERPNFSNVTSRVGSLENVNHTPKGGDLKIVSVKSDFSKVKSRVGSLDNINHVPKGGNVKLLSSKPNFTKVHSRVGSFDNIDHIPKGGDKIIFNDNLSFTNVKSRVGSLDNIQHVPKGGDVKIFDEKLKFRELATPKIISYSSTTSSVDSSVIADDDRSSLEYQTLYNTPHTPVIEVMSPIMERFEEEEIREDLSHIVETGFHDSFQEVNKHTEFSSQNNFVDNDQYFSGKETHYQHGIVCDEVNDEEDFQGNPTSKRESTIFFTENPLNDSDLSFEVNVQRKSFLLSNADINSIDEDINPASSKEMVHTVEIPPKNENDFQKLELTFAQQRIYDESWL
ncbi:12069_t:CDS:2 [Funneliformis mosseae]|uniref:12069_t:CDS:1 n=1 Tax=Funneliformis mosseae TaxID=27381 RepID=A0A9N9DAI9_FUNMO|nr:12069_t:CDS:2 [Funneliformis mosseae]